MLSLQRIPLFLLYLAASCAPSAYSRAGVPRRAGRPLDLLDLHSIDRVLSSRAPAADPLLLTLQFLDQLYNNNSLAAVDNFCDPKFVFQGCGVWLPDAPFLGPKWFKSINADLFSSYSSWQMQFLESAASAPVKSLVSAFVFFHWTAKNTGEFHGMPPTNRQTSAYGVAHFVVNIKTGQAVQAATFRQGSLEEREAKLLNSSQRSSLGDYWDVVTQPFWFPSASLQRKMEGVAQQYIQMWSKGPEGLDLLDDIAMHSLVLLDGLDIWAPGPREGKAAVKAGLRAWLQQYNVSATALAAVATPDSNKVFQPFEMQVVHKQSGASSEVRGVNLLVFNSWGWLTHVVPFRNGALEEQQREFIGAAAARPVVLLAQQTTRAQPLMKKGMV